MVFLGVGGLICRSILATNETVLKRLGGITVGIGLVLALISGFGLIGKLGAGFKGWMIGKLAIWVILGGLIAVINRHPKLGSLLWWAVILLGLAAAFLAVTKPF